MQYTIQLARAAKGDRISLCKLFLTSAVLFVSSITFFAGRAGTSLGQTGNAPTKYRTYHNVRFNYSVSYPVNVLIPQGEAANADGQKFLSKDGRTEMLVYGSHNSLAQTLRQVYDEESSRTADHPNRSISYQVLKPDWFVVSGTEGGRVFYQKTLLRNGIFKTFRIEYDASEKSIFDPITARISRSFKG